MSPRGTRSRAAGWLASATEPTPTATDGLEAKLWQSADMLHNNMDAARYLLVEMLARSKGRAYDYGYGLGGIFANGKTLRPGDVWSVS